eukprot:Awhi_evm1s12840
MSLFCDMPRRGGWYGDELDSLFGYRNAQPLRSRHHARRQNEFPRRYFNEPNSDYNCSFQSQPPHFQNVDDYDNYHNYYQRPLSNREKQLREIQIQREIQEQEKYLEKRREHQRQKEYEYLKRRKEAQRQLEKQQLLQRKEYLERRKQYHKDLEQQKLARKNDKRDLLFSLINQQRARQYNVDDESSDSELEKELEKERTENELRNLLFKQQQEQHEHTQSYDSADENSVTNDSDSEHTYNYNSDDWEDMEDDYTEDNDMVIDNLNLENNLTLNVDDSENKRTIKDQNQDTDVDSDDGQESETEENNIEDTSYTPETLHKAAKKIQQAYRNYEKVNFVLNISHNLQKIAKIHEEIESLRSENLPVLSRVTEIHKMTTVEERDAVTYEENLMRTLLSIDNIPTLGCTVVRKARKETVSLAEKYLSQLEPHLIRV